MRKHAGACDTTELVARCYAAEVLVQGWPPRWSGRSCLLIPQRPMHQPAAGLPHTRPAGPVNDDARTRGTVTRKRVPLLAGSAPVRPATAKTSYPRISVRAASWNRSFPGQPSPTAARPGQPVPETSPETACCNAGTWAIDAMTGAPAYDNSVRIGYARVSTRAQEHQAQLDALAAAHCREVIVETASTRGDRPKLREALGKLQA